MTTAIFAGSFDPFTLGHMDIVNRSVHLCDELIIGIGHNSAKKTLFSLDERMAFINDYVNGEIEIKPYDGLLADFVIQENALILIRGVRSLADFEYEMTMAQINKKLVPNVETILLPADPQLSLVSSSLLKELAKHKAETVYRQYCSAKVETALFSKFQ